MLYVVFSTEFYRLSKNTTTQQIFLRGTLYVYLYFCNYHLIFCYSDTNIKLTDLEQFRSTIDEEERNGWQG